MTLFQGIYKDIFVQTSQLLKQLSPSKFVPLKSRTVENGFYYCAISHAALFINLYIGYVQGSTNTNCCSANQRCLSPELQKRLTFMTYLLYLVCWSFGVAQYRPLSALMGARNSSTSTIRLQSVILDECDKDNEWFPS